MYLSVFNRRLFSTAQSLNVNISHNLKSIPTGFPLVQPLQKYFGGLESLPILNNDTKSCHITAVFVLSSIISSFESSPISFDISKHKWCYNVIGNDGGQFISNYNPIDGIVYALHQCLCDGILIGSKNMYAAGKNYNFMTYYTSTFTQIKNIEPNLFQILTDQNKLLQKHKFINRDFPATIIATQTGKEMNESMDILDFDIFKDINPYTNKLNDAFILTSINGANEIKSRWNKYHHLKHRDIDKTLIIISDEERPDLIKTELIKDVLSSEPYNMRYITCEGGVLLMNELIKYGLVNQLNLSLMKDCIKNRVNTKQPETSFECMDIKYKPEIGFDYPDYNCCYTLFDPFQNNQQLDIL